MPAAPPSAAKAFGVLILGARRLQRRSQDELAAQTGLSQSTISLYESGAVEPSFRAAVLLAANLNLDINVLAEPYRPQDVVDGPPQDLERAS
jgi:transcriptional regulator with XRE-family HTH domain